MTPEEAASIRSSHRSALDTAMTSVDSWQPRALMLDAQWSNCVWPASKESQRHPETGVEIETLKKVGHASVNTPAGFVSGTSYI
jgi:probable 2-oxoglutarate dehydrogenase E1 component DHKTD1